MEYKDIRENLEEMMNDNYKDFIKALVSIEKGVNDEKALEEVYVLYMNNDTTGLLSDDFDYMIDDMKEQGKIVENVSDIEEQDNILNAIGHIVGEINYLERKNSNGNEFKMSNFLINIGEEDSPDFINCFAYGEKSVNFKNLHEGDCIKVSGTIKTEISNEGKELKSLDIISSKLLQKAKQSNKNSVIEAIKNFKEEKKNLSKEEKTNSRSNTFEHQDR
ncbi:DNA-binding protein [Streptococcus dysgalactiae]|uniref:DNA-binding protein n=1 Tax=Streptococcus dysgalactiae TaxID=1334 RepID=UPI001FAAE939|nr:DNA-binding protein [Streptococcus dysgalactiae]